MIRRLCAALVLLLVGLPAHAALDCNSIFPGPIQSHDSAGTLYMQSGARVEGYNGLGKVRISHMAREHLLVTH